MLLLLLGAPAGQLGTRAGTDCRRSSRRMAGTIAPNVSRNSRSSAFAKRQLYKGASPR